MDWQHFPIIGGAYSDDARPWSDQDTVNFIPVQAERPNTRSAWKLTRTPGLVEFCDLGTNSPIRGAHDVEGLLLAVSGSKLYSVSTAGVSTEIGTIPGVQRVSMAHNQIENGFEVMVATGSSGYVYNTVTGVLAQVTDAGFEGFLVADFVDGYMAGVDPFGRFWAHSELGQATQYNTLDRYEAETSPDPIKTFIVSHREVIVFGTRTAEIYRNTGASSGKTFARVNGAELEYGCASPFALGRIDNSVMWLGHDGVVYQLLGGVATRKSTGPIEQAIAALDMSTAFAMVFEDRGHRIFYLTFLQGQTFGFDIGTQEWHRRESRGLKRWRIDTLTFSNGQWIAGDYTNGKLYRLDWDVMSEDGEPMTSRRRSGVMHGAGQPVAIAGIKLLFDTGRAPIGATDHYCSIRYSDDGAHTFSDARLCSLGATGQYTTTVDERRWGRAQQRVWDVETASPGKADLLDAYVMAERCES